MNILKLYEAYQHQVCWLPGAFCEDLEDVIDARFLVPRPLRQAWFALQYEVDMLEECLLTDAEFEKFKDTTSQLTVPESVPCCNIDTKESQTTYFTHISRSFELNSSQLLGDYLWHNIIRRVVGAPRWTGYRYRQSNLLIMFAVHVTSIIPGAPKTYCFFSHMLSPNLQAYFVYQHRCEQQWQSQDMRICRYVSWWVDSRKLPRTTMDYRKTMDNP